MSLQQQLIDQVAICAITDADGTIISANDKFVEVNGYDREELIGANHRLLNSGLHPPAFFLDMYRTISAGKIWRGEMRNKAKDGHHYWVDTHIIPSRGPDGRIDRYTAVRFEITQRKIAEEAYRKLSTLQAAILDHAGFAVISTAVDGTIELFNHAAEQMLGYRADEVIGRANPGLFHDPVEVVERARTLSAELGVPIAPGFDAFIARSLRGISNEFEWTYCHKSGRRFPVLLSVTALRGPSGELTGFLGMAADISDRREREQALERARIELQLQFAELTLAKERIEQEAAKQVSLLEELAMARDTAKADTEAKSSFLATMSHEIRTPMNGIIGVLHMLQSTALDEEQKRLVDIALRSGHDLVQITSDILDYSKLEAQKAEIEISDFNLATLAQDAVALLAPSAAGKALMLDCQIAPDVPVHLQGDAHRIRQILLNLMSNAIKFTSTGSVRVEIGQSALAPGKILLAIEVRDTGIGIAPDACAHLFDRFTQADLSTTRRFGGSGLGLAICKQLTELMGGRIGVESTPRIGSVFWVDLPLSLANRPVTDADQSAQSDLAPMHLLVAEDNATNQLIIRAILESLGHQVTLVGNGQEALESVQRGDFDLVLMDVQMPVMDGPTATREIRRLALPCSQIPIIALTANAMPGDRESYVAAGMNDYVSKPIDLRRLMEVLARQKTAGPGLRH
jgi:PAS domain S-box-containing protein